MMLESPLVQQVPGEPQRRWFSDDFFDLIVWFHEDAVLGFQLCYDKQAAERAVTWNPDRGLAHYRVDSGEAQPPYKASPVLLADDGPFDRDAVVLEFAQRCTSMEPAIAGFVQAKLMEHNNLLERSDS